ncbi:hypothetical protein [Clostridium sp.]|uniref:hypothetical protein n=1 Tax=Clostridium sp. TaxID=1506 RepID=UPI0039962877
MKEKIMKILKSRIFIGVACFMLGGALLSGEENASIASNSDTITNAQVAEADNNQTTTEKPKEETKKPEVKTTTVYDDAKVKIDFSKVTNKGVEFIVENKTDINITIQADSVAINGISVNQITMSDAVAPKSKGKVLARCSVEDYNATTVSGQLRIIDFNRSFSTYNANFVNVEV